MKTFQLDKQRIGYAAKVAEEAVATGVHPCAVVTVANSQETLWSHLVPGKDNARLDSIFLLASISKPITACAILRLVEQGKLLLHKPVADYLPEFTGGGREKITPFHLLTHTNGLDEAAWAMAVFAGQTDAKPCFETACEASLLFEPSARCQYGTLSFAVLGELITRLSGIPYPEFMQQEMFGPLGMHSTGFAPVDKSRAAPVYGAIEFAQKEEFMKRAMPGAGLWSIADDLITLGQTLLKEGQHKGYHLLSPASVTAMSRCQVNGLAQDPDGNEFPFRYGLGWGKGSLMEGALGSERAYEHGGATGTLLWIDPDYDLVFVYLTNCWGDPNKTARLTLNAVYGSLSPSEG